MSLPRLFVHGMLVAERAVFFVFDPFRMRSFIFGQIVIASFAIVAGQGNLFSWHINRLASKITQ
jgi:hypothetical protein